MQSDEVCSELSSTSSKERRSKGLLRTSVTGWFKLARAATEVSSSSFLFQTFLVAGGLQSVRLLFVAALGELVVAFCLSLHSAAAESAAGRWDWEEEGGFPSSAAGTSESRSQLDDGGGALDWPAALMAPPGAAEAEARAGMGGGGSGIVVAVVAGFSSGGSDPLLAFAAAADPEIPEC